MKRVGLILTSLGFILGCLGCTLDAALVHWTLYGAGLTAGIAGVVLLRLGQHREQSGGSQHESLGKLEESLGRLVANIQTLNAEKQAIPVHSLPQRIDQMFPEDIETFVENRKSLIYAHGVEPYAEVMTEFAAAERYLNRVWSTAVDGYRDEAATYIAKAAEQFSRSLEKLKEIRSRKK